VHHSAFGTGLVGYEPLSEQCLGGSTDFVLTGAELDPAGLSASPRVDLSLDGPARPADLRGAVDRLFGAIRHAAARNRDAESGEELFGLVFVDVHCVSLDVILSGAKDRAACDCMQILV
jgi:hypothetical protein